MGPPLIPQGHPETVIARSERDEAILRRPVARPDPRTVTARSEATKHPSLSRRQIQARNMSLRGANATKQSLARRSMRATMASSKQYFVYLLTNYTNSVIYTGVTSNLLPRVQQHREKVNNGFTSRYNVWKLVYYEKFD